MHIQAILTILLAVAVVGCASADDSDAPTGSTSQDGELLPPGTPPSGARPQFSTDFSRHTVPYDQIRSGGVPKDGIPAIDEPDFVPQDQADEWLAPLEPVVVVSVGDAATVYPIQILMWHEIVNDTVGDLPVAVTYCPLCDTRLVFARRVGGRTLDFGTTGMLRYSNLVMYDRQTESWWQQATGEAIAGQHAGSSLELVPAYSLSWEDAKARFPGARVLSRSTAARRDYGRNPYAGYDALDSTPFLYDGPAVSEELPQLARVVAVRVGDGTAWYSFQELREKRVVNTRVGGVPVAVFYDPQTASALDARSIDQGRPVGTAQAYVAERAGEALRFAFEDGAIRETSTGSVYSIGGAASSGPLAGDTLEPAVSIHYFWFSYYAFFEQEEDLL